MEVIKETTRIYIDKDLPKPTIWQKQQMREILSRYPNLYMTSNSLSGELTNFYGHSVLIGYLRAFSSHCPMKITPDILWFLIILGFHTHIIKNSENLRKKFVKF